MQFSLCYGTYQVIYALPFKDVEVIILQYEPILFCREWVLCNIIGFISKSQGKAINRPSVKFDANALLGEGVSNMPFLGGANREFELFSKKIR